MAKSNTDPLDDPLSLQTDSDALEDLTEQLEGNIDFSGNESPEGEDRPSYTLPFAADDERNEENRMGTFATYTQLVIPPVRQDTLDFNKLLPSAVDTSAAEGSTSDGLQSFPHAIPLLNITVTDPQKREQASMFGMKNGYITYLVTTKTELPNYKQQETTARRRFKDFVALSEVLRNRYRGYFIPPRPDKNVVEAQRQSESFVEERRVALQKYMTKLACHPAIARGEELQLFLEAEGDLTTNIMWQRLQPPASSLVEGTAKLTLQLVGKERAVLDPVEAAQPTKKAGDPMRALKESIHSSKMVGCHYDEVEQQLRREKDVMEEMKEALLSTSRAAEQLVTKMDRVGAVMGDLGLGFFKLSKCEESEGVALAQSTGTMRYSASVTADTKAVATTLVKMAKLLQKVTNKTAMELEPLHETLGMMPAVLRGLNSREHQLLTQTTLEAQLEAKRKSIEELEGGAQKLFMGDRGKVRYLNELKSDVNQLELSISAARTEYQKIRDVNQQELTRFRDERSADMMQLMQNFAVVQTASAQRQLEMWLHLASTLGAQPEQLQQAKETRIPPNTQ